MPSQMGLPFPLSSLRSERRTTILNHRGVRVVIDDDWRQAGEVNVGYGEWVGQTIFTLQGYPTDQDMWYAERPEGDDDDGDSDDTRDGNWGDSEPMEEEDDYSPPSPLEGQPEPPRGTSAGSQEDSWDSLCADKGRYRAPTATAAEAAKKYTEVVTNQFDNTEKGWRAIIAAGTELVRTAGSVKAAAESLCR